MVLVLVGIVIFLIRIIMNDFFKLIGLKLISIIVTLVVKKIINIIATRFVFLNRSSKILALDNFRAFNIFLYFNFFFDIFMGVISAVIRLIKSLIIAILMMPSILILELILFYFF